MTGNLEIDNTSPGEILKNTAMDVTGSSYTTNNSIGFRLQDKNGKNVAIITDRYLANGSTGLWLTGWKTVNGSNANNSLGLYVDKNGNRLVDIPYPAAWRNALGIESYTIDNSMATFTENISGTNTRLVRKNKNVYVYYQGEAKTHAANDVLFTLNSGYRPPFQLYIPCVFNQAGFGVLEVNTNGVVRITQISSSGGATARVYAHFTFPIA